MSEGPEACTHVAYSYQKYPRTTQPGFRYECERTSAVQTVSNHQWPHAHPHKAVG